MATELIGRSAQANESSSITRRYFSAAASETAAIADVAGTAPATIGGQVLRTITVEEELEDGYMCEATWGMFQVKEPPQKGESEFSFEIATAPVKVLLPLEAHTVYTHSAATAPDSADVARWLIGDQGDGNPPEGVEVFEPTVSFAETHYIDASTLTQAYRVTLMKLVGRTNNASFKGWAAGEVLVAGISGSRRANDDWQVSFRFMARENQTGLEISGITGIAKQGWQYLWPRYRLKPDGDAKILSNVVEHIVVSTVFREGDLSGLGIGT